MTKFQDMVYQRPDYDKLFGEMKTLLGSMENAGSADELLKAMAELDKKGRYLSTQSSLCYVRYTINTKDAFYAAEKDVLDRESPRFGEISSEAARIVLESPFRQDVAAKYGEHLLEKYEVQRKVFKLEILDDLAEENKLKSEYQTLMASAEIEFEGETRNLSGMTPFMMSPDRDVRRRANQAHWGWMAGQMDKLDSLYDQLVKVRDRIGKKLGYENFIPVAYARMGRTDWNQQDAKAYREQIAESVVPLTQKLYKEQAARLGISDMKNYDYNLMFLTGNPTPKGEEAYLVEQAGIMYDELSPETSEFFRFMTGAGLMDLTTRPGKANGGYMTFFPDYKAPFIFSNFNGTAGDVDVLTHEAGHAFPGSSTL